MNGDQVLQLIRDEFGRVNTKLDCIDGKVSKHGERLATLESFKRAVKWIGGVIISSLLAIFTWLSTKSAA